MNVEQKAQFIDEMRGRFERSPLVVLADFKGITVKDLDRVRRTCEAQGVHFQVVKNTLCVRALTGTDKEKLADHFRGNIAVLFSTDDPIATAKLLRTQIREVEKLQFKAGFFDGEVLDERGLDVVADSPSKEQLLAMLLGTVQAAPRQVLNVIQAPGRDVLNVLSNYAAKLESGS